jgi:hypothetical protein
MTAHIKPAEVETFSLDWGTMKWFVSPVTIPGAASSQGEVIVNPGQGHARHLHERVGEIVTWQQPRALSFPRPRLSCSCRPPRPVATRCFSRRRGNRAN